METVLCINCISVKMRLKHVNALGPQVSVYMLKRTGSSSEL